MKVSCADCACADREHMKCYPNDRDCEAEYNLDEDELSELIRNSIDERHIIDKDKLRINCRNYYTFENKNSSPSLVFKKSPEYLRKKVTSSSTVISILFTFLMLSI